MNERLRLLDDEPMIQQDLCTRFSKEHDRVLELHKSGKKIQDAPKPEIKPISDVDYVGECAVIPQRVLPKTLNIDPNDLDLVFERDFLPGELCCVVALPFDDAGFHISEMSSENSSKFFSQGDFMKYLRMDPSTHLTQGFGSRQGYYFDHLSESIKKDVSEGGCTFRIQYPKQTGSWENKVWFTQQLSRAYQNLLNILRRPLDAQNKPIPKNTSLN